MNWLESVDKSLLCVTLNTFCELSIHVIHVRKSVRVAGVRKSQGKASEEIRQHSSAGLKHSQVKQQWQDLLYRK